MISMNAEINEDENKKAYFEALDRSIKQFELGTGLITFNSIEELEEYTNNQCGRKVLHRQAT